MAHVQQFRFVKFIKEMLPDYFLNKHVLEVGSLNINGSVRDFFRDCDYVGIDVSMGNGVDTVSKGEDFQEKANSFDVAISCECMEHNPNYEKTFLNMIRLLAQDGLIVMTCATYGRAQHGTMTSEPTSSPLTIMLGQDYYKNLIKEDFEIIVFDKFFSDCFFVTDHSSNDLYFAAIGREASPEIQEKFKAMKAICIDFYGKLAKFGLK